MLIPAGRPEGASLKRAARCLWSARVWHSLIAYGIAGEVILGQQQVRLRRALYDRQKCRHARNLFSLFGQEPVQELLPTSSFSSRARAVSSAICS